MRCFHLVFPHPTDLIGTLLIDRSGGILELGGDTHKRGDGQ